MTSNYKDSFSDTYIRDEDLYINNIITYLLAVSLNIPLSYHVIKFYKHRQHTINKSANRMKLYFLIYFLSSFCRSIVWFIQNSILFVMSTENTYPIILAPLAQVSDIIGYGMEVICSIVLGYFLKLRFIL